MIRSSSQTSDVSHEDIDRQSAANGSDIRQAAQQGLDIMKDNPMLTLVAVGVLGFAIGTLTGRSSVRRRSSLDANLDSLQSALDSARSGTSDAVSRWAKTLRQEGLMPEQIPARVRQQVKRLVASLQ